MLMMILLLLFLQKQSLGFRVSGLGFRFIQHFVKDKCETIMEDVDKLDNIQDGFIHYQLIRFCQATCLQDLNGQIDLANQNCLQQQHVDFKIANALLKKGTREA